jgi:hypothetical protein
MTMFFPTLTRALIHTLFLTALTALPFAAWAAEVTNLGDSGAGSLRQAVIDTTDGGAVTFQTGLTGTITLSTGEIALAKSLTIFGPGYGILTVKAASGQRIFNVTGSGAFDVRNLTLQGGGGTVGGEGGLIRSVVYLNIEDCVLEDGQASGDGGAVYLSGGDLRCDDCIFQNNISTGGDGGALHMEDSSEFHIDECTFFSNAAYINGGAISLYNVTGGGMWSCPVYQNDAVTGKGGGMSVISGDIYLYTCSVFSNEAAASHGGGIYASGGDLTLDQGCQISSNIAAGAGGGIYSYLGSVTLVDSTMTGNTANGHDNGVGGGGIAKIGGSGTYPLAIINSIVSENQANGGLAGGAYGGCSTDIRQSTFHGNQSQGNGGGAYLAGDWNTLKQSTFSRNISGGAGGGLCLPNVGTNYVMLKQNTFWYNEAGTNGGGIETGRTTYLYACTIAENLANRDLGSNDGGGIHATNYLHLYGCIVAGNHLTFAAGMTTDDDCAGTGTNTGTYSLLGIGLGCSGIVNGVDGNLVGSLSGKVNPHLAALAHNGGPTQTCALLKGSPARDGFVDCDDLGGDKFTMDQRGRPRPRGTACDMGSFEAGASADGVMYLLINDQI